MNVTYATFILPDHDTLETHKNSFHSSGEYKTADWGEIQVRHSGNFATENQWINRLFGGINHQIEHHLFPTICHIYYPEVSRIVQANCAKYNIPY